MTTGVGHINYEHVSLTFDNQKGYTYFECTKMYSILQLCQNVWCDVSVEQIVQNWSNNHIFRKQPIMYSCVQREGCPGVMGNQGDESKSYPGR